MITKSRYEIALICDICNKDDQFEVVFYGATKESALREILKANWINHDGVTFCPQCSPFSDFAIREKQAKERKSKREKLKMQVFGVI